MSLGLPSPLRHCAGSALALARTQFSERASELVRTLLAEDALPDDSTQRALAELTDMVPRVYQGLTDLADAQGEVGGRGFTPSPRLTSQPMTLARPLSPFHNIVGED